MPRTRWEFPVTGYDQERCVWNEECRVAAALSAGMWTMATGGGKGRESPPQASSLTQVGEVTSVVGFWVPRVLGGL